jgi:hypothetical protein
MPYDGPSTPVFEDNFLVDISADERIATKWSLRQAVLVVVTMSTVFWGRHNLRGLADGPLTLICFDDIRP